MRSLLNPRSFGFRLAIAGLLTAIIESWAIARPSYWADEVATIAASSRPVGHLLHMLQTIDAVHGTYYLFIHGLAKVFGYSPFLLRFPSALAVAATAVIMAVIAKRQFGERLAWFTLIIAALLPRLVWAATEARSYGIDALLTSVMLLLFLLVLDADGRRARWLWVAYTFTVVLSTHFFIYSLLVAGVQGIWLLWQRNSRFRLWLLSMGISVAVSGFLIVWVIMEKGQVGWLPPIGQATLEEIFVGQAFWGNPTLAYIANGLILAVMAGAVHARVQRSGSQRSFVGLLSLTVLVPPTIILAYSLAGSSIYDARYFTMTAPMVALLLAIGVDQLFDRRTAYLALALLLVVSVPTYFKFRAIDAKGTHWAVVAGELHRLQQPGDGILFTDYAKKSPSQSRIMIAYPSLVKDLTDLTQVRTYENAVGLYPKRVPAAKVVSSFASHPRILVLEESSERIEFRKVNDLLVGAGFKLERRVRVVRSWIDIFKRG